MRERARAHAVNKIDTARLCVPHSHSLSCNVLDFFNERQCELLANKLCVKSVKLSGYLYFGGNFKIYIRRMPLMRFLHLFEMKFSPINTSRWDFCGENCEIDRVKLHSNGKISNRCSALALTGKSEWEKNSNEVKSIEYSWGKWNVCHP